VDDQSSSEENHPAKVILHRVEKEIKREVKKKKKDVKQTVGLEKKTQFCYLYKRPK